MMADKTCGNNAAVTAEDVGKQIQQAISDAARILRGPVPPGAFQLGGFKFIVNEYMPADTIVVGKGVAAQIFKIAKEVN